MSDPNRIIIGDSFDVLPSIADASHDSCVTDGPYGIRFMGKAWDGADIERRTADRAQYRSCKDADTRAGATGGHRSIAAEAGKYDRSSQASQASQAFQQFSEQWAREMFRILKPGAHLVSFSSPRTYHRMVCGIEDAGFEIRDQLAWLFGSGFPKSYNLEGEWDGWGTALKPSFEPIVLARKPLDGTVIANMAAHRVGALHIDACRVDGAKGDGNWSGKDVNGRPGRLYEGGFKPDPSEGAQDPLGRWPATILHDGSAEVLAVFPSEAGAGAPVLGSEPSSKTNGIFGKFAERLPGAFYDDSGSAARFFYCAKASKEDREAGLALAGIAEKSFARSGGAQNADAAGEQYGAAQTIGFNRIDTRRNTHPTVKPTDLMRWLCRLVTPPGGRVIDCFFGSGSTGRGAVLEGFSFTGIERESEYGPIARARVLEAAGELLGRVDIEQWKGAA